MIHKIQEINFGNFNLVTPLQQKLSDNQIIMAEEFFSLVLMYLEYCHVYLETVFPT